MSPPPAELPRVFAQRRATTVVNGVLLGLLLLLFLGMTLPLLFLFAMPQWAGDAAVSAAVACVGMAVFLLVWRAFLTRLAVAAAGKLTLQNGTMAFGGPFPIHVPYDRVRSLQVANALGQVGTPDKPAPLGDTLHIAGPGLSKRLVLGPALAQEALQALAALCPAAVVIGAEGEARPASGGWSATHRDAALAFYARRQRSMLGVALFGLGIGGIGLAATLAGATGASSAAPLLGVGVYGGVEWLRLRRLAAGLPE